MWVKTSFVQVTYSFEFLYDIEAHFMLIFLFLTLFMWNIYLRIFLEIIFVLKISACYSSFKFKLRDWCHFLPLLHTCLQTSEWESNSACLEANSSFSRYPRPSLRIPFPWDLWGRSLVALPATWSSLTFLRVEEGWVAGHLRCTHSVT